MLNYSLPLVSNLEGVLVRGKKNGWVVSSEAKWIRQRYIYFQMFLFGAHKNIHVLVKYVHRIRTQQNW